MLDVNSPTASQNPPVVISSDRELKTLDIARRSEIIGVMYRTIEELINSNVGGA